MSVPPDNLYSTDPVASAALDWFWECDEMDKGSFTQENKHLSEAYATACYRVAGGDEDSCYIALAWDNLHDALQWRADHEQVK